jgi:hypothetical protein
VSVRRSDDRLTESSATAEWVLAPPHDVASQSTARGTSFTVRVCHGLAGRRRPLSLTNGRPECPRWRKHERQCRTITAEPSWLCRIAVRWPRVALDQRSRLVVESADPSDPAAPAGDHTSAVGSLVGTRSPPTPFHWIGPQRNGIILAAH